MLSYKCKPFAWQKQCKAVVLDACQLITMTRFDQIVFILFGQISSGCTAKEFHLVFIFIISVWILHTRPVHIDYTIQLSYCVYEI